MMKYMMRYMINSAGTEMFGFLIVLVMTIFSIYFIAFLTAYICKGVGLYTMAKRENMSCPWLAFIPVARFYIQGELCGDITFGKKKMRDVGIWLVVLPFLYGVILNVISVIAVFSMAGMIMSYNGMIGYSRFLGSLGFSVTMLLIIAVIIASFILEALYKVLFILVNQKIFGKYTSETMKTVHAVLSALVPMYEAVAFLVLRNRPVNDAEESVIPEAAPAAEETKSPEAAPAAEETESPEAAPVEEETPVAEETESTEETKE